MAFVRARGLAAALALAALAAPSAASADETTGGATASEQQPAAQPSQPAARPAPSARLTRGTIRAAQRRLRVRADGRIGPRTRAAIRRFQRRRDLKVTGRLDAATLGALGVRQRTATPRTAPAAGPAGPSAQAAVAAAREKIGSPYRSGATGPDAFDCSGLTVYAFKRAGVTLPRTSFDQYKTGEPVARDAIQPGDLVFFSTAGAGASDVGIAVSPTVVVSATSRGVMEHAIFDEYWGANYVGARRVA